MLKTIPTAIFVLAIAVAPAFAETTKSMRSMAISGHGEVHAAPDMAIVNLGTLSQAQTAKAALDANTKDMTTLMAALKAAGIAEKDIMTSNFNVGPRYDYGNNDGRPPKLAGYDVSNTVTVTVRKFGDLGTILDKAVSSGSNQINGISFSVADPQASEDEARKLAVKDALRKAGMLADVAGVKLGPIADISEGVSVQPVPVVAMARNMAADGMAKAVPVAGGQLSINADVSIVWEIQ